MATQRYISTSFWDDEWITTLDPSEKLLYLYLMTNPLTNIAGVYQITVRRICFDTGFNSDTVGHILTKFEKAGKAYLRDGYMILPSWPQHQRPEERPKIKQGIDAILRKLPDKIKDLLVQIGYRYHIEGYPYPSNYSDSDSDSDSDFNSDFNNVSPQIEAQPKTIQKRFAKPTVDDVRAYCAERGNSVDAQKFVDYYESNGWRVGKNAMKDWRAAVRTWERNNQQVNLKVLTKPMLDMEEV